MAADENPRGRWFRALVQTIHGCVGGDPVLPEMPRFLIAMLAASATNPQLAGPDPRAIEGRARATARRRAQRSASGRTLAGGLRADALAAPGRALRRRPGSAVDRRRAARAWPRALSPSGFTGVIR